jgi:hypothetical protein
MNRVPIHFTDKSEEPLLFLVEGRILHIAKNSHYKVFAAEQFRRNCGVRFQSKRAMIFVRGICRNQFPDAWG